MDAGVKPYVMFTNKEREIFSTALNMLEDFNKELVYEYDLDYFYGLQKSTEELVILMKSYLYKYDKEFRYGD